MPTYVVARKFSSSRPHEVGETLELEGPHLKKLIEQRYIVEVDSPAALAAVARATGPQPAPEAPPPRKRGRPKKASTGEPAAPKRPRGRPKKVAAEPAILKAPIGPAQPESEAPQSEA